MQTKHTHTQKNKLFLCVFSDRTNGIQKFVFENISEELEWRKKIEEGQQ